MRNSKLVHSSNRRRCRTLYVERLERRTLLAGNGTAALIAGNLDLTGDSSSNAVQVSQVSAGTWKVQGL